MQDTSFVIDLWPSAAEFAADIGVPISHVHVMRHRRSVPVRFWSLVERKAVERNIAGASAAELARAAADHADIAPPHPIPPTAQPAAHP